MSAQQVLQKSLCAEPSRPVIVWILDESSESKPLCRQWLRKAVCAWGDKCRHGHYMTLSKFGLQGTRGAAMPAIVKADAEAVFNNPTGSSVAFVMLGNENVYDFEDPCVAHNFLHSDGYDKRQSGIECETSSGDKSFLDLNSQVAVSILLSAGVHSACRAVSSCRQWQTSVAAECFRKEVFKMITGTYLHRCTGEDLGDIILSSQLLLTSASRTALGSLGSITLARSSSSKTASVTSQGECIAVVIDEEISFCVFRAGDLRCYRLDNGQLLGTCQARRLGKNHSMSCACLVAGDAIVLGDTNGGLTIVMRNDLSEAHPLRQSAASAVTSLTALGSRGAVISQTNGVVEVATIAHGQVQGIHLVCTVEVGLFVPALALWAVPSHTRILLCTAPSCIYVWNRSELDNTLHKQDRISIECDKSPIANIGMSVAEQCSLSTVLSMDGLAVAASSSTSLTSIHWWSLKDSVVSFEESTCFREGAGGVSALSSMRRMISSCHADGSIFLWHPTSHVCIMDIQSKSIGSCVLAMSLDCVAFAHTSHGKGNNGKHCCLEFCSFGKQPAESHVALPKEAKRDKPAKMFAHKSRGGKKNFESKQSGRHTSLSKCTR